MAFLETFRAFYCLNLVLTFLSCSILAYNIEAFDYVIVGGGVAGFVVAEYLSRDPLFQVLLLEAGPDGTNVKEINTPGLALQIPKRFYWNYTSQAEPQRGFQAFPRTQGHGLGGGSAVNYMQYCRGAAISQFDRWASETGVEALKWENILHDFEATSHYAAVPHENPYSTPINTSVYGNGPVEVSQYRWLNAFDRPFQESLSQAFGLQDVDFSTGVGVGTTWGDSTVRVSNSTRDYSFRSFGWQMAGRQNVRIEHDARVTRLGFKGNCAQNITYLKDGQPVVVSAREIILSAGAIGSPKILMLSGVGPKDHLADLGIPLVADLSEVGTHLYDHHGGSVVIEVPDDVGTSWQLQYNASFSANAAAEYQHGEGFLSSSPGGTFAVTCISKAAFAGSNVTHSESYTSAKPDREQIMFQPATASFIEGTPNVSAITVLACLTQPQSFGYVRLNSTDYRDDPLIYSNYFGTPADQAAITYAYKQLRDLLQSKQMSDVVVRELFPGPDVPNDDDNALWKSIQKSPVAYYHPMGTLGLGRVLDKQFRVKGLHGVRVVDASVFPDATTCHPQANVYAVSHAAARMIRQEMFSEQSLYEL